MIYYSSNGIAKSTDAYTDYYFASKVLLLVVAANISTMDIYTIDEDSINVERQ